MLKLGLRLDKHEPLRVLCLGCHSDDIEIGCGGTILRLIRDYPCVKFYWVVFSALGARKAEAQQAAGLFAGNERLEYLLVKDFMDGFMPYTGQAIKSVFEELKQLPSADLILTHQPHDAHQDHRLISELTWNTFRDHTILEYEIPKYDGDMGRPSVFVPLESEMCEKKVDHLMQVFASQHNRHWFEPSTFTSLMRLRGMECNSPSKYAEAFYCRKLVL